MQWYRMDIRTCLERLGSSAESGLADEEARQRLVRHGPNRLADEDRISLLALALHQFTSPLIAILLVAALVTFLLGERVDTGVILAVVVLNAVIGFFQEYKAEESKGLVVSKARGVVVATGGSTVLGGIAGEVREIGATKAPIQEKIERFAKAIGLLVLMASGALFGVGILLGGTVKEMFMTAVAAAVATIPEGLPIVVTIALAVGVGRMARHNAIIRRLPAVETLGSTTVICSDKTGTLTKNEMTVTLLHDGVHTCEVEGSGYEPAGEILRDGLPVAAAEEERLAQLLRIGLLCNESDIYEEDGAWRVDGDPTEGALIVAALKGGLAPVGLPDGPSRGGGVGGGADRFLVGSGCRGDRQVAAAQEQTDERVIPAIPHQASSAPLPVPSVSPRPLPGRRA